MRFCNPFACWHKINMGITSFRARKDKEQDAADPISFENVGIVGDWVMEKKGCLEAFGNSDWMSVDRPLGNTMLLGPTTDDVEDLGADGEEENVEDNIVSQ